jgi:hypothetical protein
VFLGGNLILFQTSAQCLPGFPYRIGDDESPNACAKVVPFSVVVHLGYYFTADLCHIYMYLYVCTCAHAWVHGCVLVFACLK